MSLLWRRLLLWGSIAVALTLIWAVARVYAEPTDTLDIGITGDDYLWMETFQTQAEAVAAYFVTIEPFKSNASLMRFFIVPTQRDLYCSRSSTISRVIVCNGTVVRDVFTEAGYDPDKILVLWNTSTYGGSGGDFVCTSYTGSQMKPVAAHECLGHTIGTLADEYLSSSFSAPNQDTWFGQCWKGEQPPDYVGTWVQRCNYPNFWRQQVLTSTGLKNSLMYSLSTPRFNTRSIEYMLPHINRMSDPFRMPPVVELAADETDGIAPLSVTLTARGVALNGGPLTYAWSWN